MPKRGPDSSADVDFVVGPAGSADGDELLDTEPPRHGGRRFVIAAAIAALVIVGIVVTRSNTDSRKPHPTASAIRTGITWQPVGPKFPAPGTTIPVAPVRVRLDADLCPRGPGCFHPATPRRIKAHISDAIRAALGGVSQLRITDADFALYDTSRKALFARKIRAVTPFGRLAINAAAIGPDHVPLPDMPVSALFRETTIAYYALAGGVEIRGVSNAIRLDTRLERLISDPRLVA